MCIFTVLGVTRIGREDAPIPQDITIQGPGIEAEHCLVINEGLFAFLHVEGPVTPLLFIKAF